MHIPQQSYSAKNCKLFKKMEYFKILDYAKKMKTYATCTVSPTAVVGGGVKFLSAVFRSYP